MAAVRLEWLAMIAVGGVAGCWTGGQIAPKQTVPAPASAAFAGWRSAPAPAAATSRIARRGLAPVDYDALVAVCEGCSDFQLGYRLAREEGVSETADCDDYAWSFARGCLAYLRDSRG